MKLIPLTKPTAIKCVTWRNECLEALRTPFALTDHQQSIWWDSLQDRNSPHRYFEDEESNVVCGLTNIDWTNRNTEISLIVNPTMRKKDYGFAVVKLLKEMAFKQMNLHMLYGECYHCSGAFGFWKKYFPNGVTLKDRKFWGGRYHDSFYFWVIND